MTTCFVLLINFLRVTDSYSCWKKRNMVLIQKKEYNWKSERRNFLSWNKCCCFLFQVLYNTNRTREMLHHSSVVKLAFVSVQKDHYIQKWLKTLTMTRLERWTRRIYRSWGWCSAFSVFDKKETYTVWCKATLSIHIWCDRRRRAWCGWRVLCTSLWSHKSWP